MVRKKTLSQRRLGHQGRAPYRRYRSTLLSRDAEVGVKCMTKRADAWSATPAPPGACDGRMQVAAPSLATDWPLTTRCVAAQKPMKGRRSPCGCTLNRSASSVSSTTVSAGVSARLFSPPVRRWSRPEIDTSSGSTSGRFGDINFALPVRQRTVRYAICLYGQGWNSLPCATAHKVWHAYQGLVCMCSSYQTPWLEIPLNFVHLHVQA